MMIRFGLFLAALVAPATAMPKPVFPGDKLLFVLSYRNQGAKAAENFVVTNPIPGTVRFVSNEGDAQYSVDGGRNWGRLATLKVKRSDGLLRAAQPDDVTHIRWTLARPIPVGGFGSVSFNGLVK